MGGTQEQDLDKARRVRDWSTRFTLSFAMAERKSKLFIAGIRFCYPNIGADAAWAMAGSGYGPVFAAGLANCASSTGTLSFTSVIWMVKRPLGRAWVKRKGVFTPFTSR